MEFLSISNSLEIVIVFVLDMNVMNGASGNTFFNIVKICYMFLYKCVFAVMPNA